MDRTGWIIVAICILGMVGNMLYIQSTAPERVPVAGEVAGGDGVVEGSVEGDGAEEVAELAELGQEAEDSAEDSAEGSGQDLVEAGAGAGAGEREERVGVGEVAEEIVTLNTGKVAYRMSTRGGGVARAEMLDAHDGVVINAAGYGPIGALSWKIDFVRNSHYEVMERSDRHVVFRAVMPEGLEVRKTYTVVEAEAADGHLLAMRLDLKNVGELPFQTDELSIYAGSAHLIRSDPMAQATVFWHDGKGVRSKAGGGGFFGSGGKPVDKRVDQLMFAGVMERFYTTILSGQSVGQGRAWGTFQPHDSTTLIEQAGRARGQEGPGEPAAARPLQAGKPGPADFVAHAAFGLPRLDIAPGAEVSHHLEIYVGPKERSRLTALGGERKEVMLYGWFTFVSVGLYKLLLLVHGWVHTWDGSWGWAIIFMTVLLRTAMWPIYQKSTVTMKRMALLQPKIAELKEKYPEDPQKMQMEQMKLFREYGVNPLGGCLPLLLQIPIFLGFFRMLMYTAEVRGESFLWVSDLSVPDTVASLPFAIPFLGAGINPLPILMTVTSFLQMAMAPKTGDKTQRMIFMFMPVMILFFCYNFASALALYWTTSNLFSILQTWLVKRQGEPELKKKKVSSKPSFAEALEARRQQLEETRRTGVKPGAAAAASKKARTPRTGGGGAKSRKK